MTSRSSVALGALALVVCALAPLWADGPSDAAARPQIVTGRSIHHDTSPPLRDIAIRQSAPTGFATEVPIRIRPGIESRVLGPAEPDGGLQSEATPVPGAAPTPAPTVSTSGLSEQDNVNVVGFAVVPPDINGDIGLDAGGNRVFIQYINSVWGVFDGSGNLTDGPFAGNSFWQGFGGFCQANNDGDPVVLYDDQAGRWMASQFSIGQGIQCVAVSTTSDPLGSYHRYAFTVTPGGNNDYPKLGVWDDGTTGSSGQSAYTFTTRDFGGAGGSFSVGAGVMERDAMLVGASAQFVKFINPCNAVDCIEGQLPPHLAGPPPPAGTCPTFFAAADAAFDDSPYASDGYRNHTLCVDWSNLNSSTYTEGALALAGSNFDRGLGNGFSDCISPVNGGEMLDCLAIFTMYRAQYRWFGSHASVVLNTTVDAGGGQAGIRWAEVRSSDGDSGWSTFQDGTYAPADGVERWMGSIAMDGEGNIALGYSATSGSLFPSVRYTTRTAGDAPGTMPGGEVTCHEGTGAQRASSNRWGDYSSMSIDPTDDCTFWYTQEYYETTGSFDFNTRICAFKLADCGGTCTPTPGEESMELSCTDGTDNDCDGFIDCADSDCYGNSSCACNFNSTCDVGEDCTTCPSDCVSGSFSGAVCGNGLCEAGNGEDCVTCPSDCNGKQNGKPSGRFCCGFGGTNALGCGDSRCTTGGFQCTETPVGGGGTYCCGDLTCEGAEDSFNCALDCGAPPVCGNGIIEFGEVCDGGSLGGETCSSQGCSGGVLTCLSDCSGFDTSSCTGCSTCVPTHSKEKGPRCVDGLDNDCDGLIDGDDPDCQ